MSLNDVWEAPEQAPTADSPIVGLDFGTSNSCVCVWDGDSNRSVTIRNSRDSKITPSNVTYMGTSLSEGAVVGLGDSAVLSHTISGIKSHLAEGLASELPGDGSQQDGPPQGVLCVSAGGEQRVLQVEAVAAEIMGYLRRCAEEHINSRRREQRLPPVAVCRAVVGVPAACSERQKTATRVAAKMAGFSEVHFMVESTAAALSYGLLAVGRKTVLVLDMGGGTLDVTLTDVDSGRCSVLATAGHPKCGGFSIDRLLAEHVVRKIDKRSDLPFELKYRLHQHTDRGGGLRARLRALCRAAKECLSDPDCSSVAIELPLEFFQPLVVADIAVGRGGDGSTSSQKADPLKDARGAQRGLVSEISSSSSSDSGREEAIEALLIAKKARKMSDVVEDDSGHSSGDSESSSSSQAGEQMQSTAPAESHSTEDEGQDQGEGVWRWAVERTSSGLGGAQMAPLGSSRAAPTAASAEPTRHVKVEDNVIAEEDAAKEGAVSVELTRAELDRVIAPVLGQLQQTVLAAVQRWRDSASAHHASTGHFAHETVPQADGDEERSIDEVVLVGGSSRVLSVRAALRRVVGQQPEGRAFSGPVGGADEAGGRALCSSVNPDQAVAQGLAIRGAILMGVDRGLLKDVLMLDMLSTSIGLRCFTRASPSVLGGSADEDLYEPILCQGDRLPAKGSKSFRLASPTQKLVTVEAFEQLEVASEGGRDAVLTWQYMGTFTCVVPSSCRGPSGDKDDAGSELGRFVQITFKMSESGALSVAISPPEEQVAELAVSKKTDDEAKSNATEKTKPEELVDEESERAVNFLIGVIVFLVVVYLVTKLFILERSLFDFDTDTGIGEDEAGQLWQANGGDVYSAGGSADPHDQPSSSSEL